MVDPVEKIGALIEKYAETMRIRAARDDDGHSCNHGCIKDSFWVPYTKDGNWYCRPCPVHRSTWMHPDERAQLRAQYEAEEAEAARSRDVRRARGQVQGEQERRDW